MKSSREELNLNPCGEKITIHGLDDCLIFSSLGSNPTFT